MSNIDTKPNIAKDRLSFIDGMRGWGALVVYLFHLSAWLFYEGRYHIVDKIFYHTPLRIMFDAESAIYLFFVLSGFSLSYSFFSKRGDYNYVLKATYYRYFRLLVPVFFAVLFTSVLIKSHFMANTHAYVGAYTIDFSFIDMLKYVFFQLPFIFGSNHYAYGPVLWTIYVEFTASLLIFSFLALFGTWNFRFLVYLILMKLFYAAPPPVSFYFPFILGVIICDLFCMQKNSGISITLNISTKILFALKYLWGILSIVTILLIYNFSVVHHHIHIFTQTPSYLPLFVLCIFTLYTPLLKSIFSSRISKFLGRISFSLYLIHFPILCSLACYLHQFLVKSGYNLNVAGLITILVTTPVVFITAYVFTLFIEEKLLLRVKTLVQKMSVIHFNLPSLLANKLSARKQIT